MNLIRSSSIYPPRGRITDPAGTPVSTMYETIEDAGYSRETIRSDEENGLAGSVGVFVGVMYEEYQLFGAQESLKGRNIALFGNPASIANRVSYFIISMVPAWPLTPCVRHH